MAGTPHERVDDIHTLFASDDVDALMASWGGKSANQLVNRLDYARIARFPKPFMAFSDGGVLGNAITAQTGMITFYGPNVVGKLHETKHSDLAILRLGCSSGKNLLGAVESSATRVLRGGNAVGRLFGGNLSTFALGCVGTRAMPVFKEGGIFFWESASEPVQIIDQYLTYLRNTGIFDNVTGMIVGDFIHDDDRTTFRRDPFEMILSVLDGFHFPIVYCRTFGHPPSLENPLLPIGALCTLSSDTMTLHAVEDIVR
jgi:muramoyltetrapeptide carboxypeptidase